MTGISVIICCYNSAQRLQETLKHLANQRVNKSLNWEIVVVDNNSTDSTNLKANEIWQIAGNPTPLISIKEERQGLSNARAKGMHVARYDIILWCDDDNWLCESYVQTAYEIMISNVEIGALGGWCEAVFEGVEPEWFNQQAHFFAVSKQGRRSGDITLKKGCLYGAGMILRKSHWLQLKRKGFKHLLTDRIGNQLSSGGDTEYTYALRLLGHRIWFDERLYFKHFMPEGRLNLKYLARLRQARTHSNFILWPYLDLLKGKISTKSDLLKYAFKGGSYRFIRQSGALLIGSFEQKQVAIRYFMFLNYCLFNYGTYNWNLLKTKKWLQN